METGLLTAWTLFAGAALLLVLVGVLAVVVRSGRRSQQQLIASRADLETLDAEVRALSDEVAASRIAAAAARQQAQAPPPPPPTAEHLITTAGVSTLRPRLRTPQARGTARSSLPASDRVVVPAAIGRPLVKLAALGYGVRRALAPQTRNRIAFEMRREVKRARKQRKREQRQPHRPDAEAAA
jgi:outer membrane murein-binding lipoprotein Lpp